jgi:hypothetical protein
MDMQSVAPENATRPWFFVAINPENGDDPSIITFNSPAFMEKRSLVVTARGLLYENDWIGVAHAIGSVMDDKANILYQYDQHGQEVPVDESAWLPGLFV